MAKLNLRLDRLEKMNPRRIPPPMYYRWNQTREEAEENYVHRHGFKLPDNAKVVQYVRIAPRKTSDG